MKVLLVVFRCVLTAFLLLPVLGLSYCCGYYHIKLLEEINKEPYLCISPDAVDPANEGRKVQLVAPAYTDEWLELPDIGVRCQALRLELNTGRGCWVDGRYVDNRQYRGLPLRSRNQYARCIRMGAFSLKLCEHEANCLGNQKIPMELVHLPEAWQPYCRVVQSELYKSPYFLNLELEDDPPRGLRCSMIANGTPVAVRGIQRGNEIYPVHGVHSDEQFFKLLDSCRLERVLWNALAAQGIILMVPALLLGVFRLQGWKKAGQSTLLVVCIMLVLEAVAFIFCSGWQFALWVYVAAGVLLVCLWQIVRIVRSFRVDSDAE